VIVARWCVHRSWF